MAVIVKTNRQKWINAVNTAKDTAMYALPSSFLSPKEVNSSPNPDKPIGQKGTAERMSFLISR